MFVLKSPIILLLICSCSHAWISFYSLTNYRNELVNITEDISTCMSLTGLARANSQSLKTTECVYTYPESNCNGESFRYYPSWQSNLQQYNDKIVSIRGCNSQESILKINEITFYFNNNYEGDRGFGYSHVYKSCINLNLGKNTAQAIKTRKCALLFDEESCVGNSFKVQRGDHPDLTSFNKKAVSFRGCDENEDEPTSKVKFYRQKNFAELAYEGNVVEHCYSKNSPFPVLSASTPICLKFYSQDYFCRGEQTYMIHAGNSSSLPGNIWNDVKSFMPCSQNETIANGKSPLESDWTELESKITEKCLKDQNHRLCAVQKSNSIVSLLFELINQKELNYECHVK